MRPGCPDKLEESGYTGAIVKTETRSSHCRRILLSVLGIPLLLLVGCGQEPSSTPLMTSVALQDVAEVRRLLDNGADPNERVGSITPLIEAARLGNLEIANLLLKAGAKASVTMSDGWTPLMALALRSGDTEVADTLIRAGANVCSRTDFEEFDEARASEVAARSGHQPLSDRLGEAERSCKG